MNNAGNRHNAIVITGPTGVGKTSFAIDLAREIGGEIISADSRLVYRGLDVGTDKPTREQLAAVPHHLIDIVEPGSRFTVSDFLELGASAGEDIASRGKIPIFAGGTCMYISAMLHGYVLAGHDRDSSVRAGLEAEAASTGAPALHERLSIIDPQSAARIHPNDARRIVRALEVHRVTGMTMTQRNAANATPRESRDDTFRYYVFGLCAPRKILFEKINKRVDSIYNSGLIDEARNVLAGNPEAADFLRQVIGYAQALDFLQGETGLEEAMERTAKATREFARRQIIWFRRMVDITWLNRDAAPPGRGIEIVLSALNKTN